MEIICTADCRNAVENRCSFEKLEIGASGTCAGYEKRRG